MFLVLVTALHPDVPVAVKSDRVVFLTGFEVR